MKIKRKSKYQYETANNSNARIKSKGYGKYKFPIYDEIKSGQYFSRITDAYFTTTSSGKTALEVLYEIKDSITCYKIANGILPFDAENKSYYIKQRYPKNTPHYEGFVDSMAEALGAEGDDIDIQDIIGVTEYVTLSYGKSDMGGFSERFPFEWDDFIKINQDDNYEDDTTIYDE